MNSLLSKSGVLLWCLAMAAPGWAVMIVDPEAGVFDGADVGVVDNVLGSTNDLSSTGCPGNGGSPAREACWAETITGMYLGFSDATKSENVRAFATDSVGAIALMLNGGPGYYVINNARWWAVVQNLASMDWGVILAKDLPDGFNVDTAGMTISHVTEAPRRDVPESGTFGLLAVGLLALIYRNRRRFAR